ncbi:MAG: hypothetical protein AAF823_01480 [Planctomycetota bacterium]
MAPTDSYLILNAFSRPLKVDRLAGVQAVAIHTTQHTETPAKVFLSLHDELGERFYLRTQTLKPGSQTLQWSFPDEVFKRSGKNANNAVDGPVVHGHLYVERPTKHAALPIDLTFHGVELTQQVDPIELISADLDTGDPLHAVHPEQLQDTRIFLTNEASEPITLVGEIGVRDLPLQATRRANLGQITVPANDSLEVPIPESLIKSAEGSNLGIRYADWRFVSDDSPKEIQGKSSFAVMSFVGPTTEIDPDAFVFGLAGFHSEW